MIQTLDDGTIAIECIRPQQESYGPPFSVMIRKPHKVPMSDDMREAYSREWSANQEVVQLKERIAKVIDLWNTTPDPDVNSLPNQIVRILRGENCAA